MVLRVVEWSIADHIRAELDYIDIVSVAGRLSHTDRARLDIARVLVPLLTLPSLGIIRFSDRGHPLPGAVASASESPSVPVNGETPSSLI